MVRPGSSQVRRADALGGGIGDGAGGGREAEPVNWRSHRGSPDQPEAPQKLDWTGGRRWKGSKGSGGPKRAWRDETRWFRGRMMRGRIGKMAPTTDDVVTGLSGTASTRDLGVKEDRHRSARATDEHTRYTVPRRWVQRESTTLKTPLPSWNRDWKKRRRHQGGVLGIARGRVCRQRHKESKIGRQTTAPPG